MRGSDYSETADLLEFSHTAMSGIYRERNYLVSGSSLGESVNARDQRRRPDSCELTGKKVAQIIAHYNQSMQKSVSECRTCQTLKQTR